jgi:hypothetical protein
MVERLGTEYDDYRQILYSSGLPDVAIARTERQAAHLGTWRQALASI